jgi:hypothetical protein
VFAGPPLLKEMRLVKTPGYSSGVIRRGDVKVESLAGQTIAGQNPPIPAMRRKRTFVAAPDGFAV